MEPVDPNIAIFFKNDLPFSIQDSYAPRHTADILPQKHPPRTSIDFCDIAATAAFTLIYMTENGKYAPSAYFNPAIPQPDMETY